MTHAPEVNAASLEALLSAAVAAPSIHNTQPWRFGMDPATGLLQVRVTRQRSLPLADPVRRAQHLSVGAAVFNLRVAAEHLGWEPVVRLLPDPADPDLLATVRLTGPLPDRTWSPTLYTAIGRRHTSRLPFTGRPVPEPVVADMVKGAQDEGGHLLVPGIVGTRRLLFLTSAAEQRNAADRTRTAESRAWVTAPGASPYGIPASALGARDTAGRMPMRDFTGPLPTPHLPAVSFERHAQVALLWTANDRQEDWLRAGQALEHTLLVATAHGVRTSMLHQAMEWPDLREALLAAERLEGHPQILIRFGYGPDGVRTPRVPGHRVTRPIAPPAAAPQPASSRQQPNGTSAKAGPEG